MLDGAGDMVSIDWAGPDKVMAATGIRDGIPGTILFKWRKENY